MSTRSSSPYSGRSNRSGSINTRGTAGADEELARQEAGLAVAKSDSATSLNAPFLKSNQQRAQRRTFYQWITGSRPMTSRRITPNGAPHSSHRASAYPANIVRNQKYHLTTFLFVVLYNQFKFFFNLYFLLVCLSQFVPMLRVTYLITSILPLALVLTITISKEAHDDYKRYRRDREANSQLFTVLQADGAEMHKPSSELAVGDVVRLHKDERVPADMLLLRTVDPTGSTFIRTDQLDGETDWKLRLAVQACQKMALDADVFAPEASVEFTVDAPQKDIHSFIGTLTFASSNAGAGHVPTDDRTFHQEALGIEHVLWMNTVIAGGSVLAMVIYTGPHTRACLNTSAPETKMGLVEQELNALTKVLCLIVVALALALVAMRGFYGLWLVYLIRFVVLFSTIIPLR